MASIIGWLRLGTRLPLVVSLVLGGLATVVLVFPALRRAWRDRVVAGWSRALLRACGVRLHERPADGAGTLAARRGGHMLLANHVSWLDIFLILSIAPAHFVAKAEIARWPVLGALVSRVGTLFIERGKRHAVHRLNRRIVEVLGDGRRVALFPEGTTSDGTQLLPFHGNLIEAALHAQATVVPVGLRYLDGALRPTDRAIFVGDVSFVASVVRVLSAPVIVAEVHPLPPVEGTTRQMVAERARRAIGERLGLAFDDEIPEVVRQVRAQGDGR
ncbi:MAG: 1-acyl-sn-glycerol-3-phosphate acyltransferase [Burkholderiales bacterium]|nr:MAG: 1-acyl-sn-glycerol-3-phosphate acyltransferase [Burkholderiales bacterium]